MKKLLLLSLVLASVGLQARVHKNKAKSTSKTVSRAPSMPKLPTYRIPITGIPLPQKPKFAYPAAYEELEGEYKYLEGRVNALEAHMNRIADAWMEEDKVVPERLIPFEQDTSSQLRKS